jgi:hypothetical protein
MWIVSAYNDTSDFTERRDVPGPLLAQVVADLAGRFDNVYAHRADNTFECVDVAVGSGVAHFWHGWASGRAA